MHKLLRRLHYEVKPYVPRRLQLLLRSQLIRAQVCLHAETWPIDRSAATLPARWSGWPEGREFAFVLTHDVEWDKGQHRCADLMKLEKSHGFRSSFNFVPRRYDVSPELRRELGRQGFEVGVHGLYHDGLLYSSRAVFQERAKAINDYLREWGSVGFRSPAMLHNLEWIAELNVEYDCSTFDTDPFEPQSDSVGTIFPFIVPRNPATTGYVELPYTLPQDFTVFILMKERNIDIWKKKTDWVTGHGGMVLMNTHPDYVHFGEGKVGIEEYPVDYLDQFYAYIRSTYDGRFWHALPREVARFWGNRSQTEPC